jgi:hypothetical protein
VKRPVGALAALLFVVGGALAASPSSWPFTYGPATANRVQTAGKGSFPAWRALTFPTASPLAWIVALSPRRLAAIDAAGTFMVIEVREEGLRLLESREGLGSAQAPPVALRLGGGTTGFAFVARDGQLALWAEETLKLTDLGDPLSPLTHPTPLDVDGDGRDELLAVERDGALLLIGGLPAAPRILSHLPVKALPDARITLGDLDGDSLPDAVVLTDPTDRYRHGILGDAIEAAALTVVNVRAYGLTVKGKFTLPPRSVFEDLVPILADIDRDGRPEAIIVRSYVERGSGLIVLGWREGKLISVAESAPFGRPNHWTNPLGAADLGGDGIPAIITVHTPHIGGVLHALRPSGGELYSAARIAGFSSHAIGSRNQDQALVADLNGNGRPEVVIPRQSRAAIAGLEIEESRFVEGWSYQLQGAVTSNLVAADLNGDGALDLAVADRKALHVLLSKP